MTAFSLSVAKLGNVKTQTDRAGRTTTFLYDAANRLRQVDAVRRYSYDPENRRVYEGAPTETTSGGWPRRVTCCSSLR